METKDSDPKNRLKNMKLKEVHKVWGQTEAEIIKGYLESQGIPCLLQGRIHQSLYPFDVDGLGEIKIFTSEEDYDLATELLENREEKQPD
jgi:hypothetical protein